MALNEPTTVDAGLWSALSAAIIGVHNGDREAARAAAGVPAAKDYSLSFQYGRALQYMAFAALSRRIAHRPMTVDDARDTLTMLAPAARALGVGASDGELLNAIKIAILLPPEPWFDPDDAAASARVVGAWLILVGLSISGEAELQGMRAGVDLWLKRQSSV